MPEIADMTWVFQTAFIAACLALPASAAAQQPISTKPDPFVRADKSFSRFPLNKPGVPQSIGRLTNGDRCDDDSMLCEWQDKNGVVHIFGGKLLAIKSIDVKARGARPINALNIGAKRLRRDVLVQVRAFLPEIKIKCLEAGKAGEGDGISSCGGSFQRGGWFKLLFDRTGMLTSARIDAFQIN